MICWSLAFPWSARWRRRFLAWVDAFVWNFGYRLILLRDSDDPESRASEVFVAVEPSGHYWNYDFSRPLGDRITSSGWAGKLPLGIANGQFGLEVIGSRTTLGIGKVQTSERPGDASDKYSNA